MSHNINHIVVEEKCNRKNVQAECDAVARHEDWQEGCTGVNPIRWLDNAPICATRDEAERYINDHDKGWYDCLAVRFKELPYNHSNKALDKAREKITECYHKYAMLESNKHFANVKSEFVGCKACGSRIAVKYIDRRTDGNHCAVCGEDLRPQTTLDTIAKYKANWNKAKEDYTALEKELAKKNGKVMWLVKYEYHT